MRIAVGLKAHSGWAALVVIGRSGNGLQIIDRRRIELVEPKDASWAKQPYHAADGLPPEDARKIVERGVAAAGRMAAREMRALVERSNKDGHQIAGCAVLVGTPMPEWTIEEIRSVHVRMHKAEGILFPAALISAAEACGLKVIAIPEKSLEARAEESMDLAVASAAVVALGKSVGPPCGKDQKTATLAAMIVLEEESL
ncbi:MAG TPA: hypothetical protein VNN08_26420 [Thermoanaerobaculia bacterium]|nr:hypothetical protein [Thermoanaerobaculia bacterium]